MKRDVAALLATLLFAACAQGDGPMSTEFEPAFSKNPGKVVICHLNDEGGYNKISVSAAAEAAHLAHGDVQPGTGNLDENCEPLVITLDPTSTYSTATAGGGGGGPFDTPCPAGSVAVGIGGTGGSYFGWAALGRTYLQCAPLAADGTLGAIADTPAYGGWYMTPFVGTCPAGQVLIGVSGNANWAVNSMAGQCASVATVLAGGGAESGIGPFAGSGVTGGGYALPCSAGYAITGVYGGVGDILDRVGFTCTKIVQS